MQPKCTTSKGGVYTLDVEQLHDLQSWCVHMCVRDSHPIPPTALTRRSLRTEAMGVVDNGDAASDSGDDEPVVATRSRAKEKASGGGASKKGAKAPPARTAGAAPIPTARLVPAHLLRRGTTPCARGGGRRADSRLVPPLGSPQRTHAASGAADALAPHETLQSTYESLTGRSFGWNR